VLPAGASRLDEASLGRWGLGFAVAASLLASVLSGLVNAFHAGRQDVREGLAQESRAMELILQKSLQSARASAFYSYLCGGLSAAGAVGAWFYLPVPFLVWFTAGCSFVFLATGIWYGRFRRTPMTPARQFGSKRRWQSGNNPENRATLIWQKVR